MPFSGALRALTAGKQGTRERGEKLKADVLAEEKRTRDAEDRQRKIDRDALETAILQSSMNQPKPPVRGTQAYLDMLRDEAAIGGPEPPVRGTPEYEDMLNREGAIAARHRPPPSPTSGLQVVQTPDGFTVVDKSSGTSRPVMGPGAGTMPQGGRTAPDSSQGPGQLQPRPTGAGSTAIRVKTIENRSQMRKIQDAMALLRAHPKAVGLNRAVPLLGDILNQRVDPEGMKARAAIADVGSLVIHDRSGAAVTAAEWPRLQPFIPKMNDTHEAALIKLQRFYDELELMTQELEAAGGSVGDTQGGGGPPPPAGKPDMARIEALYQQAIAGGVPPADAARARDAAIARLSGGGGGNY